MSQSELDILLAVEKSEPRISMSGHIAYYFCHTAGASFPVIGANVNGITAPFIGFYLIRRPMGTTSHFRSSTGTPDHLCHVRKYGGRRVMRRTPAKDRAMFLRERALKLVLNQHLLVQI